MKYHHITKWEQINRLQPGDQVIVCWSKSSNIFAITKQRVHLHKVREINRGQREVILTGGPRAWFGIKEYLLGRSVANSVHLVDHAAHD